jgi:hypothetical protein
VYSASEERSNEMKRQFADLNDGITPINPPFELISQCDKLPETKPTICCLLSFIKALEYFVLHSKSKYAIFLEDDAALKKTELELYVKNIMKVYEEKSSEFDYISLGYNIGSIRPEIVNYEFLDHHMNVYWSKQSTCTIWGTQAQLFSRKKAIELFNIIGGKKSCSDLYKTIELYKNKHGRITYNLVRLQLDAILPMVMKQAIVYPPIVIERNNIKSLIIENHTHAKTWETAETQGIYLLKDFYSY